MKISTKSYPRAYGSRSHATAPPCHRPPRSSHSPSASFFFMSHALFESPPTRHKKSTGSVARLAKRNCLVITPSGNNIVIHCRVVSHSIGTLVTQKNKSLHTRTVDRRFSFSLPLAVSATPRGYVRVNEYDVQSLCGKKKVTRRVFLCVLYSPGGHDPSPYRQQYAPRGHVTRVSCRHIVGRISACAFAAHVVRRGTHSRRTPADSLNDTSLASTKQYLNMR